MKKLILGLALTAGTFAFAQQTGNTSSNPVTFGVKGGMNVSSLSKKFFMIKIKKKNHLVFK